MPSPLRGSYRQRQLRHACDGSQTRQHHRSEVTVPEPPTYGRGSLGAVLPGIAAALGRPTPMPAVDLPKADRICIVLIDGLGNQLLAQNEIDAPFLSKL